MRVLFLTLKKMWFDEILSGRKKIEYREIKPRITSMLKKDYDVVLFQNGYRKDSRRLYIEYLGYNINKFTNMYEIQLGEIKRYNNGGDISK